MSMKNSNDAIWNRTSDLEIHQGGYYNTKTLECRVGNLNIPRYSRSKHATDQDEITVLLNTKGFGTQ